MVRDGSLLERTFGAKQPEYYRGGEPTARRVAARRPRRPRRPRPAQLLQAGVRGHAALAGAEALDELEARRDERVRAARRRQHRRRRRSSPAAAPRATTSRRCRRSRSCRSCASATCRQAPPTARGSTTTRTRSRPRSRPRRRLALDDPAARLDVAAGRDRQPPHDPGRHRPADRVAPAPRSRCREADGAAIVVAAAWSSPAAATSSRTRKRRAAIGGAVLDLVCGTVPRAECEARRRSSPRSARTSRATVVTVRLDADGGYSIDSRTAPRRT